MVSSADHDSEVVWSDFPKGLRVLLLDEDEISAAETKLKLEAINYIVFAYHNESEAMEAIHNKAENFHVAIVEVSSSECQRSLRFLEMAKDLPTIAISNVNCLSTMMKCIALGAAEFLQKPLSEEKLRNLWQHVVHKVFNAGGNGLSKSLQPIKETVVSMLQLRSDTPELRTDLPTDTKIIDKDHEETKHDDDSEDNDKFPAPSTPQLVKGGRLMDEGYFQGPQNFSKDNVISDNANYSNSKFVDNATTNLPIVANSSSKDVLISSQTEDAVEKEETSDNGSKTDECSLIKPSGQAISNMSRGESKESSVEDQKKRKSFHCNNKNTRRKMKVDWTPDLHRKFVQAVEQLGVDQAIPSKILELMNVEGLTRHNIASHLQKYRMNRRHILPKDDSRRWQQHKDSFSSVYMQKTVTGLPPPCQIYPFWGQPSYHTPVAQVHFPTWQPHQRSWPWKTHARIHADAWGCPVVPPYRQFAIPSPNTFHRNVLGANESRIKVSKELYDNNLAEEVIDRVVKEAISKPWLPLPLGLKAPSVDSVLTELQQQGIRSIPSASRRY